MKYLPDRPYVRPEDADEEPRPMTDEEFLAAARIDKDDAIRQWIASQQLEN